MYQSTKTQGHNHNQYKTMQWYDCSTHTCPNGPSQRIITPPSWKVCVPSTNQSQNQNSQTPIIPQEKQLNERIKYVPIVLSYHPRQRRRHHRIPKKGVAWWSCNLWPATATRAGSVPVTQVEETSPSPALPFLYECTPGMVTPRKHTLPWRLVL